MGGRGKPCALIQNYMLCAHTKATGSNHGGCCRCSYISDCDVDWFNSMNFRVFQKHDRCYFLFFLETRLRRLRARDFLGLTIAWEPSPSLPATPVGKTIFRPPSTSTDRCVCVQTSSVSRTACSWCAWGCAWAASFGASRPGACITCATADPWGPDTSKEKRAKSSVNCRGGRWTSALTGETLSGPRTPGYLWPVVRVQIRRLARHLGYRGWG